MDMHHIRYFLAVVEEQNFTRAARARNVSQPALSRAIAQLEHEFGGGLFVRGRDSARLTELGHVVLPFLLETAEAAKRAKRAARAASEVEGLSARVGVMCTIGPVAFASLLSALRDAYPRLELSVVDGSAVELQKRLLDREIDCAIFARPRGYDRGRIFATPLFREQMVVILPPNHSLAERAEVHFDDLMQEAYVNRVNCEFNRTGGEAIDDPPRPWKKIYRCERDDWAQALVASGVGFGFLPVSCVSNPDVIAKPLRSPGVWREILFATVVGQPHGAGLGAILLTMRDLAWPNAVSVREGQ